MYNSIAELEAAEVEILTCQDVAHILKIDPNSIRFQAHENASKLGFPVTITGRRVRIPRLAFIKYMKGEEDSHHD